jgi:hypothetical protein
VEWFVQIPIHPDYCITHAYSNVYRMFQTVTNDVNVSGFARVSVRIKPSVMKITVTPDSRADN